MKSSGLFIRLGVLFILIVLPLTACRSAPGLRPSPEPPPTPFKELAIPSELAISADRQLKPALESGLGIGLQLKDYYQSEEKEGTLLSLRYRLEREPEARLDMLSALREAVEALGGTVAAARNSPEGAVVYFRGLIIANRLALGSINFFASGFYGAEILINLQFPP